MIQDFYVTFQHPALFVIGSWAITMMGFILGTMVIERQQEDEERDQRRKEAIIEALS